TSTNHPPTPTPLPYTTLFRSRADDRLMFDVQMEIAERTGYTSRAGTRGVERFMKHYYLTAKDVGDLTRIFCAALEAEHQRRPRLDRKSTRLNSSHVKTSYAVF